MPNFCFIFYLQILSSVTWLHIVRFALFSLVRLQATFVSHKQTTFWGCFFSSDQLFAVPHPPPYLNTKKPPQGRAFFVFGRSDWIRTSDFYVPNVAFYQAELHSVSSFLLIQKKIKSTRILYFFVKKCIYRIILR